MDRQFKRAKKGAVQLTSLLDLLFVMIFVSLMQQKEVSKPVEKPKPVPKIARPKKQKPQRIVHNITASFNFYGKGYKGTFLMEGIFNKKSGRLNLTPVRWLNKPPFDIGMVPLSGDVSSDEMGFTGRVSFAGCKTFDLKRVKVSDGSPIAGEWKGTYVCAQGETGLKLSIQ